MVNNRKLSDTWTQPLVVSHRSTANMVVSNWGNKFPFLYQYLYSRMKNIKLFYEAHQMLKTRWAGRLFLTNYFMFANIISRICFYIKSTEKKTLHQICATWIDIKILFDIKMIITYHEHKTTHTSDFLCNKLSH